MSIDCYSPAIVCKYVCFICNSIYCRCHCYFQLLQILFCLFHSIDWVYLYSHFPARAQALWASIVIYWVRASRIGDAFAVIPMLSINNS